MRGRILRVIRRRQQGLPRRIPHRVRVAIRVCALNRMKGAPGQVVILGVEAANHGVAARHVSHGQHPRRLDRREAAGSGKPQQIAVPLRNVMVGPDPRHGGLLRAPDAAVDTPQSFHLVQVSRVVPAVQGRRAVRPELRGDFQGQRQHVRHPCAKRCRRCGGFIDSRAGGSLDVGHHAVEPVVGSKREHPDPNFFANHDAIRLRVSVGYPNQVGEVEIIQDGLLIGESAHEHVVRGGGDGGLHRRVRRHGWCDRVRPIAALDGDDRVVDCGVDDAHENGRLAGKPPAHGNDGVLGDQAPVCNSAVLHWTVRRPEPGSNGQR